MLKRLHLKLKYSAYTQPHQKKRKKQLKARNLSISREKAREISTRFGPKANVAMTIM